MIFFARDSFPVGGAKVSRIERRKSLFSPGSGYPLPCVWESLTAKEGESIGDAECKQMEKHYLIEFNFPLHICQLLYEMQPEREWVSFY